MSVHSLARSIDFLRSEIPSEINITTLAVFLAVASRGRCNQKEIEEELGLSNASCSRNVSYWCDRRYDREAGFGFIQRVENYDDRRYKELTLTPKGQAFYESLREASKASAKAKGAAE
jgi:DNA-binding MarR family transcriptional regulator